MSWSSTEIKELLKGANMRATSARVAVLQLLERESRPLSHTEVVQALDGESWDQATLYRNLIKLTEGGFTRVASELAGVKRYELGTAYPHARHLHPHFVCNACGEVRCLPEVTITQDRGAIEELGEGWRKATEAASLHLVGCCPRCA